MVSTLLRDGTELAAMLASCMDRCSQHSCVCVCVCVCVCGRMALKDKESVCMYEGVECKMRCVSKRIIKPQHTRHSVLQSLCVSLCVCVWGGAVSTVCVG